MELISCITGSESGLDRVVDKLHAASTAETTEKEIFVITTGYFSGDNELVEKLADALSRWLRKGPARECEIHIGYWGAVPGYDKTSLYKLTTAIRQVVCASEETRARAHVRFIDELHAKSYSMWAGNDQLLWALIGSSNVSSPSSNGTNIELDVFIETGEALKSAETGLRIFRHELLRSETEDWKLDDIISTARSEVEIKTSRKNAINAAKAREAASAESDKAQGIAGCE